MPRKNLYEICEICDGKKIVPPDLKICIDPPSCTPPRAPDGVNFVCPSCDGRGFIPTGLSASQVNRIIRERDEATTRVAELTREIIELKGARS